MHDIGKAADGADSEGHTWRRSSRCGQHGSCVEMSALGGGTVGVRDGKAPDTSPVLVFDSEAWLAFIAGIKAGEFG
jgi:Domain of unknown function (DUF397)